MLNLNENYNKEEFDNILDTFTQGFINKLKQDGVLFTTDTRSLRVWYDPTCYRTNEYGWYAWLDCPKNGPSSNELDFVDKPDFYRIASAISIKLEKISIGQALDFIPMFYQKLYTSVDNERKNAIIPVSV